MKKILILMLLMLFATGSGFTLMLDIHQQRGCCSHHGGVCGCSNGRAVCCDGSYSPSCGCD